MKERSNSLASMFIYYEKQDSLGIVVKGTKEENIQTLAKKKTV